jgi:hypothetical protein
LNFNKGDKIMDIVELWNKQADEFNTFQSLSPSEIAEFAESLIKDIENPGDIFWLSFINSHIYNFKEGKIYIIKDNINGRYIHYYYKVFVEDPSTAKLWRSEDAEDWVANQSEDIYTIIDYSEYMINELIDWMHRIPFKESCKK